MASKEALSELSALVVDDNEHMIEIASAMLRAFGFGSVQSATNAQDGLKILEDSEIDLVIIDYRMPNFDGIKFTRALRSFLDESKRFIPAIMLSAHAEKARICMARDNGVTEFLCKPLSATEFYKKIFTVIEKPRPFVCVESYFGPDRRRRHDPTYHGPERRNVVLIDAGDRRIA